MPRNPNLSTIAYSFGPGPLTPAVRILLWANGITYFATLFFPKLVPWLGLIPQQVIEAHWLWQPVTYMFVHARWPTHILFNMLILWMFGVELERLWRTKFFVRYYFVTGIGAGVISVLLSLLPFQPLHQTYILSIVGASGAIYGLLMAYALYTVAPETVARFGTDKLALTIPFPLYGIFRYLYLVHQKKGGGSPSTMLLTDKPLLVCVGLWVCAVVLIIYRPLLP